MNMTGEPTLSSSLRRKRWLLRIAGAIVMLPAVLFLVVVMHHVYSTWMLEEEIWFDPAPAEYGNWQPQDLAYEDIWFDCQGEQLHGWLVEHESPRAVVLFLHGSSGNLSYRDAVLRTLHDELQCTAMVFDYRGFGRSDGKLNGEAALYEDSRAARKWLAARLGISESEIVLYGRSLGSALAIDLAAGDGARGLVVQNAFASLPDVAHVHYRFAPAYRTMRYRLNSIDKIGGYHGYFLQSHAGEDEVVPLEQAMRLFAAANEPKTMLVEPNATHGTPMSQSFIDAFDQLIDEVTAFQEGGEGSHQGDLTTP